MLWPRSSACAATFPELFVNRWPVVEVEPQAVSELPQFGGFAGAPIPDLAGHPAQPVIRTASPLIPLSRGRRARLTWNGSTSLDHDTIVRLTRRAAELAGELEPVPAIRARTEAVHASSFRPTMIGVHLRRGDFTRLRPEVTRNFEPAARLVEAMLRTAPDAGVLLCTDDGAPDPYRGSPTPVEGTLAAFSRRFPGRVVASAPRSLDRRAAPGIEDALVDLLLLRQVDMFVGTRGSSFSELATFGRDVPSVLVGRGSRRHLLLRYTGIEAIVVSLGFLTFRRPMPAATVIRLWRRRVRGRLRPPAQ